MSSARHAWLATHPFLEPIALFQGVVEDAAARSALPPVPGPAWEAYAEDQAAGVPLLHSAAAGLDLSPAGDLLGEVAERVAAAPLPAGLESPCRDLRDELREPEERRRAMAWVVAGAGEPSSHPGLLRFLGWTAASRALEPVIEGAERWRDEERWGRGHCPTCGSLPMTAQLVAAEAARPRRLVCSCCRTRWRYRRIGCPFCGAETSDRLGILETEAALRIDFCEGCKGYVKTYTAEGDEELFLADWPTLHLDLLARGRGLRRLGTSLYELPHDERRTEP